MNRFEVIEKKDNTMEHIITNPVSGGIALADFYKKEMRKAAEEKTEILCFDSIAFVEKNSDNFQNIYILEKAVMDFFRSNEYPKKVRIVCEDQNKAELYKVVYNFYYPSTKEERLEDDRWD